MSNDLQPNSATEYRSYATANPMQEGRVYLMECVVDVTTAACLAQRAADICLILYEPVIGQCNFLRCMQNVV